MRNKTPISVHHIGATMTREFNLRQDVPDEFQVDLRDTHASIAARARKRQRHVGLGFPPEVYWAVVHLVRYRFGESRLRGHVLAAADNFHREARYFQLLMSRGVYFGELCDRRHLSQQSQCIEAS